MCGPEKRDNQDILIKGTYFLSTGVLGSHNIVLGYDNFAGKRSANNYQSGSNYRIFTTNSSVYNGDIFPVFEHRTPTSTTRRSPTLTQGTNTHTKSAFLNDQWRLNDRLSFNLGVRYDKNDATEQQSAPRPRTTPRSARASRRTST